MLPEHISRPQSSGLSWFCREQSIVDACCCSCLIQHCDTSARDTSSGILTPSPSTSLSCSHQSRNESAAGSILMILRIV